MRITLYKAQRKSDRQWIYCFPYTSKEHNSSYLELMHDIDKPGCYVEIIPDTLCECIGRQDENYKYIFENDIVVAWRFQEKHQGKIVYNEKVCAFELRENFIAGAYGERATHTYRIHDLNRMKVIGNMIDNPALLDKKE